jgi:hypothetical protein
MIYHYQVGIAFSGNELVVRTDNEWVAQTAASIFRHHLHSIADESRRAVDVVSHERNGSFQFIVEGQVAEIALSRSDLPVTLMQLVQRQLIFRETRYAMLHAAVLARHGHGFLFPAAAGSGKTTLTAWLLGHGYGLLSDELASIDEDGTIDGFTRPLNIKPGSRHLLEGFEWMRRPIVESHLSCGVTLIPWNRQPAEGLSASAIIFPSYVAHAGFKFEQLSFGLCAKELMGSLLNARNLPKHGLSFATRFAKSHRGYRVTYSNLEDVSSWMNQLTL